MPFVCADESELVMQANTVVCSPSNHMVEKEICKNDRTTDIILYCDLG